MYRTLYEHKFSFSWVNTQGLIAGSYHLVTVCLTLQDTVQPLFQNGCTILHSQTVMKFLLLYILACFWYLKHNLNISLLINDSTYTPNQV